MALDYSKLSTEELEAIANDDYSKLSTETLNAIANDPDMSKGTGATKTPASLTPQQVDAGDAAMLAIPALAAVAPKIPEAVASAYQTGKAVAGPAASAAFDLGKAYLTKPGALVTDVAMSALGLPPPVAAEQSLKGVKGTYDAVRDMAKSQGQFAPKAAPPAAGQFAAAAEAPTATQIAKSPMLSEMAARSAPGAAPSVMSRVAQGAGSLLQGASSLLNTATPAMSFAMPYQMAAEEQAKIRANPTAPQYATNPYAQQYRGEYATQGAAGAANTRNALANRQFGGLTPEQQAMLEQDKIDQAIRRKAAQKVLGPVIPPGY